MNPVTGGPHSFVRFTSTISTRFSQYISEKNSLVFLAAEGKRNHFEIQLSLSICGAMFPGSLTDTKIHRCPSPLYKMTPHSQPSVYMDSAKGDSTNQKYEICRYREPTVHNNTVLLSKSCHQEKLVNCSLTCRGIIRG